MSKSEVYRPSNGELLTRPGPVHEGFQGTVDSFRKSRPSTQAGYRFGQLSHNSFFTRHNPHPARVRHIKGLLDIPICAVNDDGYFANPRYSLQFPPDAHTGNKLNVWKGRIPVNAINVNSQLHPINTVTGLQYFTGLSNYPWREKAVPNIGLVPVTETWRDELRHLTEQLGLLPPEQQQQQQPQIEQKIEPERPKTVYSAETGRIIPPPSRAMSRRASREGSRQGQRVPPFMHIAAEPDLENVMMTMLCQILQTEDINAVQAWLCSAGEREKGIVMDLIQSAMTNKDDYYKHDYSTEFVDPEKSHTKLPPINERPQSQDNREKRVDRLIIDEHVTGQNEAGRTDHWREAPKTPPKPAVVENGTSDIKPPDTEAFKKAMQQTDRPASQSRMKIPINVPSAKGPARPLTSGTEAKLRYTKSSRGEREKPKTPQAVKSMDSQKYEQQLKMRQAANPGEWSQQISLGPNTF